MLLLSIQIFIQSISSSREDGVPQTCISCTHYALHTSICAANVLMGSNGCFLISQLMLLFLLAIAFRSLWFSINWLMLPLITSLRTCPSIRLCCPRTDVPTVRERKYRSCCRVGAKQLDIFQGSSVVKYESNSRMHV